MVLFLANQYRTCQPFSKGNLSNESVCNLAFSCSFGYHNASVTFIRYRGQYLMRRISNPSNGSFSPYAISNKEAHNVNGNIFKGGEAAKKWKKQTFQ